MLFFRLYVDRDQHQPFILRTNSYSTAKMATLAVKRKETTPPDGYVCHKCNESGHWIQQCPRKADDSGGSGNKRRKKSDHVPVAGVDPSQTDIDAARQMQKVPPPSCFCGISSRLKKVKRSNVGGDASRALGKYFFFCSKKRDDETACRFARPVEDELMDKKDRVCSFWARNGSCKKGDKCMFSHDAPPGKARAKGDSENDATAEKEETKKVSDDAEQSNVIDKHEPESGDEGNASSSSDSSSLPSSSSSDDSSSVDDDSSDDDSSSSSSSDDSSSKSESESDDDDESSSSS